MTLANGTVECDAVLDIVKGIPGAGRVLVRADKIDDVSVCIDGLRDLLENQPVAQ